MMLQLGISLAHAPEGHFTRLTDAGKHSAIITQGEAHQASHACLRTMAQAAARLAGGNSMSQARSKERYFGSLVHAMCAGLATLACVQSAGAEPTFAYPPAPRGAVVEDTFGTRVADPYRWLEELDSPATRGWVQAQGKLTSAYLASIPAHQELRARLRQLNNVEQFGIPFREGNRYFFTRNTGLQNQSVLFTVANLVDSPQLALDPNLLSSDGTLAVVGYIASRDGNLLAYGVSVSGSDWTEWRIRNLRTGKDLPDVLRYSKYYAPVFSHDGTGLYYSAFPAPPAGAELSTQDLNDALYYHSLGSPVSADKKIFQESGHPTWQFEPHLSDDGRWLVIAAGDGEVGDRGVENIYVLDLASKDASVKPVAVGFDAAYIYVGVDAGNVFVLTTRNAARGSIIAFNPEHPERNNWKTVIAEGRDAIDLTEPSVTLVDHELIVRVIHDAHTQVHTYGLDGKPRRAIVLPAPGTARGFSGHSSDRETFYSFTNLITPPTVYRYDAQSGVSTVFRAPKVAFDASSLEEHQVLYAGKDGTRIPMQLAYRKGMKLNGRNPLLLYGYGGFGVSLLPEFNPSRIAWLEMGGIYAIANIRGGGEYGEAWHRQAIRTHKQVVFDDFIAAAEWLIAQHYTSTAKLAIQGGSNGGLLVGACETQRPDLYGAVIAQVGVMDMLRFDRFGQGAGWVGDYGSPHNGEDFKALYAYSPVHNVRPGGHYPATLIITGDHDTRVMPMHSFKFAAELQHAQAGPAPVLLYLESSSGHGGGPTLTQAIDQSADIYAFLIKNLAMDEK
jgi:prolyl oligopeptidase